MSIHSRTKDWIGGYDDRDMDEHRSDNIAEATVWIEEQGFEVVRIGIPKNKEYFVNFEIEKNCWFYGFIRKERKILRGRYFPLKNFNEDYKYFIVCRIKEEV